MDVRGEIVDALGSNGDLAQAAGRGRLVAQGRDVPRWSRRAEPTHEFAVKLAAAGYDVAVPDVYRGHGRLVGFEHHAREVDPTLVDRLGEMLESASGVYAGDKLQPSGGTHHELDTGMDRRAGHTTVEVNARSGAPPHR